ncbi:MAG: HNH endonuclease [Actinomycetota bacterium]|nr:HNH endonuclease [Actinomycetota bacterium]
MGEVEKFSDHELYEASDDARVELGRWHREHLRWIREFDKRELWDHDGCHNVGQWLAGEFGITVSQGLLRANAARVVENLPYIAHALEDGILSLDKVVQLCRFATPATDKELVSYARRRSLNAIRERADYECRKPKEEARDAFENRYFRWWRNDHMNSIGLEGYLPAAQGALVTNALTEIADRLKLEDDEAELDEDGAESRAREQRYADALVELALGGAGDTNSRRPLLVVHTTVDALLNDGGGSEIEGAGAVHPTIAQRISCDTRLQDVLHDSKGKTVGIGFVSRNIPDWLRRAVIRRDRGCVFPGCGTMRYVDCHHIVAWPKGPTNLDNLILLCHFHHDLVHEGGWRVELDAAQLPVWYRPDGSRYERARRPASLPAERPIPVQPTIPVHHESNDGSDDDLSSPGERKRRASVAVIAAGFS